MPLVYGTHQLSPCPDAHVFHKGSAACRWKWWRYWGCGRRPPAHLRWNGGGGCQDWMLTLQSGYTKPGRHERLIMKWTMAVRTYFRFRERMCLTYHDCSLCTNLMNITTNLLHRRPLGAGSNAQRSLKIFKRWLQRWKNTRSIVTPVFAITVRSSLIPTNNCVTFESKRNSPYR